MIVLCALNSLTTMTAPSCTGGSCVAGCPKSTLSAELRGVVPKAPPKTPARSHPKIGCAIITICGVGQPGTGPTTLWCITTPGFSRQSSRPHGNTSNCNTCSTCSPDAGRCRPSERAPSNALINAPRANDGSGLARPQNRCPEVHRAVGRSDRPFGRPPRTTGGLPWAT